MYFYKLLNISFKSNGIGSLYLFGFIVFIISCFLVCELYSYIDFDFFYELFMVVISVGTAVTMLMNKRLSNKGKSIKAGVIFNACLIVGVLPFIMIDGFFSTILNKTMEWSGIRHENVIIYFHNKGDEDFKYIISEIDKSNKNRKGKVVLNKSELIKEKVDKGYNVLGISHVDVLFSGIGELSKVSIKLTDTRTIEAVVPNSSFVYYKDKFEYNN